MQLNDKQVLALAELLGQTPAIGWMDIIADAMPGSMSKISREEFATQIVCKALAAVKAITKEGAAIKERIRNLSPRDLVDALARKGYTDCGIRRAKFRRYTESGDLAYDINWRTVNDEGSDAGTVFVSLDADGQLVADF